MKNNPILQIFKMLLGGVGSYYSCKWLFACNNEYVAPIFLFTLIVCALFAYHGFCKLRGEDI